MRDFLSIFRLLSLKPLNKHSKVFTNHIYEADVFIILRTPSPAQVKNASASSRNLTKKNAANDNVGKLVPGGETFRRKSWVFNAAELPFC